MIAGATREVALYENAGIEPTHYDACTLEDKYWKDGSMQNLYGTFDSYLSFECPHHGEGCYSTCEYAYDKSVIPPFTAEKQIAILEFCLKWGQVHILQGIDDEYRIENSYYRKGYQPTLADAIANYINEKWEKLTPEERKQIKEILE